MDKEQEKAAKARENALKARENALKGALTQIERQFGQGSIMKMGDEAAAVRVQAIPTGALSLDLALGVGGGGSALIDEVACVPAVGVPVDRGAGSEGPAALDAATRVAGLDPVDALGDGLVHVEVPRSCRTSVAWFRDSGP
jgi:hypothetical protein